MTKVAFIADVHSNLEALNAVLTDIEERGIKDVYCLGDLVGYGPNPNEVVETIMKKNIPTVCGNYDEAVGYEKDSCGCSYSPGREAEVGDESLRWTIKNTKRENKELLKSLPHRLSIEIENVKILLVHGSSMNYLLEYVKPTTSAERLRLLLKNVGEDIVVNGHTHLVMAKHTLGKTILNPGSVGRTKNGRAGATYLILNIDDFVYSYEFVFVEYDVKKTIEKILSEKLPVELAIVLVLGQIFDMGPSKLQHSGSKSTDKMNFTLQ